MEWHLYTGMNKRSIRGIAWCHNFDEKRSPFITRRSADAAIWPLFPAVRHSRELLLYSDAREPTNQRTISNHNGDS